MTSNVARALKDFGMTLPFEGSNEFGVGLKLQDDKATSGREVGFGPGIPSDRAHTRERSRPRSTYEIDVERPRGQAGLPGSFQ